MTGHFVKEKGGRIDGDFGLNRLGHSLSSWTMKTGAYVPRRSGRTDAGHAAPGPLEKDRQAIRFS